MAAIYKASIRGATTCRSARSWEAKWIFLMALEGTAKKLKSNWCDLPFGARFFTLANGRLEATRTPIPIPACKAPLELVS